MLYSMGDEFILPYVISFLKAPLYITELQVKLRTDVAVKTVMNRGGILLHRLQRIKNR